MSDGFRAGLERGRLGEQLVSDWLQSRGWGVVPVYERSGKCDDKAPRMLFRSRGIVLPDLDACRSGSRKWCEVKTYAAPAWNRACRVEVHGIPGRLFRQYVATERESGCRVVIAVLEVRTGELLMSHLLALPRIPCLCSGCRGGYRCVAPGGIVAGIYWPRPHMRVLHRFGVQAMAPIRSAWGLS